MASDPSRGTPSERPHTFAEAREKAIDVTVSLTGKLSTILAIADVLAAHGHEGAGIELRGALMKTIRALHVFRHQLLALDVSSTASGVGSAPTGEPGAGGNK